MVKFDESTSEKGRRYIRDRRSEGGGRRGGGGRGVGRPVAAGGGLLGVIIAIVLAFVGLGGGGGGSGLNIDAAGFDQGGPVAGRGGTTVVDPDADTVDFMSALMFDIQDTWDVYFDEAGLNYEPTTLTIFTDFVETGCGNATSAVGPFYCPAPNDRGVYVDLDFYNELSTRFGAPGDFAQAYVIAHEVGHHIQAVLGISDAVRQAQADDPGNKNEYSIRQELQADCLAGVWAFSANNRVTRDTGVPIVQEGDIEEGLDAAAAVGDDRIQESAGVGVNPHTWTHGSSAQRIRWFRVGFETGDPEQCDTFAVDNP